jgi:hypothetical protein
VLTEYLEFTVAFYMHKLGGDTMLPTRGLHVTASLVAVCILTGCAIGVPDIKEVWDSPEGTRQIEFEIKRRIFCDLGAAVRNVNSQYRVESRKSAKDKLKRRLFIPADWGAQLSLSLQVDESTSLNPGVALNTTKPNAVTTFVGFPPVTTPQSSSLGFGGTLSSTATRVDKFNPYYSVADLMVEPTGASVCNPENDPFKLKGESPSSSSPFLVLSDLGVGQWLEDAMWTNIFIPSSPKPQGAPAGSQGSAPGSQGSSSQPDTITLEIKFIIVSSGNVTPTWKLVRVSANTGNSPLFATGRTRTHDLIITIGPNKASTDSHLFASEVGQAVSGANGVLPPKQGF